MCQMYGVRPEDTKSQAEKDIYSWFLNDPKTADWVVFHSLPLENHVTRMQGEIDFLVLAPHLGIFALEVKGGRVSREADGWHFIDKNNKENVKSYGPFEQASDGIHTIMDQYLGKNSPYSKLLFWFGVMMPDITFDVSDPGWEPQQIFDERNEKNVGDFIIQLSKYTQEKWKTTYGDRFLEEKLPDKKQILDLAEKLRPVFDKKPTYSSTIKGIEEKLVTLTKEQCLFFDAFNENSRILVYGGAGTGKTLLAIEDALSHRNEKVAFLCYNDNLADYFKAIIALKAPDFKGYVGTINSYLIRFVKSRGVQLDPELLHLPEFYDEMLPTLYEEAANKEPEFFSRLIIDEAQDVFTENNLDVLSLMLDRGFVHGSWSMFGDFSHQSIYRQFSKNCSALDYLEDNVQFSRVHLKTNCRNSFEICSEINYITNMEYEKQLRSSPSGLLVMKYLYSDYKNEADQIGQKIRELIKGGVSANDIAVLSPFSRNNSCVSQMDFIKNYNGVGSTGPFFETIQSFKGLESKIVLLCDISDFLVNPQLIYVGLSRARDILVIYETKAARTQRQMIMLQKGDING